MALAQVAAPELVALEVIAEHARRTMGDHNTFAVGGRRRRTIRVCGVRRLFVAVLDLLVPELLAVLAIQAEQAALLPLLGCLSEEDAVAPDDRRRVARARQRDLPAHVLGGGPVQGKVAF